MHNVSGNTIQLIKQYMESWTDIAVSDVWFIADDYDEIAHNQLKKVGVGIDLVSAYNLLMLVSLLRY